MQGCLMYVLRAHAETARTQCSVLESEAGVYVRRYRVRPPASPQLLRPLSRTYLGMYVCMYVRGTAGTVMQRPKEVPCIYCMHAAPSSLDHLDPLSSLPLSPKFLLFAIPSPSPLVLISVAQPPDLTSPSWSHCPANLEACPPCTPRGETAIHSATPFSVPSAQPRRTLPVHISPRDYSPPLHHTCVGSRTRTVQIRLASTPEAVIRPSQSTSKQPKSRSGSLASLLPTSSHPILHRRRSSPSSAASSILHVRHRDAGDRRPSCHLASTTEHRRPRIPRGSSCPLSISTLAASPMAPTSLHLPPLSKRCPRPRRLRPPRRGRPSTPPMEQRTLTRPSPRPQTVIPLDPKDPSRTCP